MIIIGEKINSTLKAIRPAMESRDKIAIQELALLQKKAGADYIDVNAGMFYNQEAEIMDWLINTIQEVSDTPFAIDSPSAQGVLSGLKANRNKRPLINSITGEKERFNAILPLVVEYKARVVALCMNDQGMPETVHERVKIAETLINNLVRAGVALDDIFIDPLVRPIGTGSHYGILAIETIRIVKKEYPEVHIACGLSNVSFGIPARKIMNQAFLVAAMAAGMDGAILDPLDKKLMAYLYAADALLGRDDYCLTYLEKFREGSLVF